MTPSLIDKMREAAKSLATLPPGQRGTISLTPDGYGFRVEVMGSKSCLNNVVSFAEVEAANFNILCNMIEGASRALATRE